MAELDRSSSASVPGILVPVSNSEWTDVLSETEADEAVKFIIQVPPFESQDTVAFALCTAEEANAGMAEAEGDLNAVTAFSLVAGGTWDEDRYAGPVCAISWGDETATTKAVF